MNDSHTKKILPHRSKPCKPKHVLSIVRSILFTGILLGGTLSFLSAQEINPRTLIGSFCLSKNSLAFSRCILDPNPVALQTITIRNCGNSTLSWFTSLTYNSPQTNWVNVSPANGALTAGDSVTVGVTITGALLTGSYSATINLSSPNANNSPQRITLTYTVFSEPRMQITPRTLTFTGTRNSLTLPQAQSFSVTDSSRCNLQWSAATDTSWVQFGIAGRGQYTDKVNVWLSTTNLIADTHRAVIHLTSPNASNKSDSVVIYYIVADELPAAPDSLRVIKISDTQLDVVWRDRSTNEDGFVVERKPLYSDSARNASAKWDTVGYTFPNVGYFRDLRLQPCSAYAYRVLAFNALGASPYSNIDSNTTCRERGILTEQSVFAYPNPLKANQTTTIQFPLTQFSDVTIRIVDAANTVHRMIQIPKEQVESCTKVSWDGRNGEGKELPNGVYFYLITSAAGERAVGKIAVLR